MGSVVTVEEVTGGKALVRFAELPTALHGADPRFAWPVVAWERARVDQHRNDFFDAGEAMYLLARRAGQPVGRIAAHVAGDGAPGHFGFFATDDDLAVARALVDRAAEWLAGKGCDSMTGPLSFTAAEEEGLLAEGFDVPGLTGRPWHPPSQVSHLVALGFGPVADRATWRLAATEVGPERARSADRPPQAGPHSDPRLVLEGIAAVPDLSPALRDATLRSAWALARRARRGDWDTATVVRCDDDPAVAVPALLVAAAKAGYREVIAPWCPDPARPPETMHRTFTRPVGH